MSFDGLMNQTATFYRATRTRDSLKSEAVVWSSLGTARVRVWALSATERAMLGGTGTDITHRLACRPADFTPLEKDEVQIGSTRYGIKFINDVDAVSHHWQLDLQELRHG